MRCSETGVGMTLPLAGVAPSCMSFCAAGGQRGEGHGRAGWGEGGEVVGCPGPRRGGERGGGRHGVSDAVGAGGQGGRWV